MSTLSALENLSLDVDERLVVKAICEESLYEFVKHAWPHVESAPFIDSWHIGAICEHLQAVTCGQIPRLLINVPPGCSKSLLCSVFWPMWEWASCPEVRWFYSSYDQQLSTRDSVRCRTLMEGEWYQSLWGQSFTLTHDQNQKTFYRTSHGGYRLATSVGGHGTGEHPDRIVVDDPHNVRQAESEVERQAVLDWWDLTMTSRGVSRAARRVVIMQRLHPNDLSAHLIAKGDWVHICLPMRHEPNRMSPTPLGWDDPRTEEGELLTPQQFPEHEVVRMEKDLGEYGAAGQLQQRPTPRGGAMFKDHWFSRRVKAAPHNCRRVRYWDRACLRSGTLVETSHGPRRIEDIRAGDYVLTRQGYKMVRRAWITKYVSEMTTARLDCGTVLEGTADHRVWTANRGWVDLADLHPTDCIGLRDYPREPTSCISARGRHARRRRKSSCSRVSATAASRGSVTSRPCAGTRCGSATSQCRCTALSGNITTAPFLTDISSITRIRTGIITTSPIWSVSPANSTARNTAPRCATADRSPTRTTCAKSGGRTRGRWRGRRGGISPASTVAPCSVPDIMTPNASGFVLARAAGVITTTALPSPEPVYDLEVEDAHEFFANGVLVHNSTQDGGCYTAGVLMAKDSEGRCYVEDVVKGQWEPDERNKVMRATALRDRAKFGPRNAPVIYVEREGGSTNKDAWLGVVRALAGFTVKEDQPTGSKDARAEPWACQLAAGNVFIVDNGESEGQGKSTWDINGYVQEHVNFRPQPGKRLGKFKDQVDSSSGAFNLLFGGKQIATGCMRIYSESTFHPGKLLTQRALVLTEDELPTAIIDVHRTVLVYVSDPDPVGNAQPPPHALSKLQDTLVLRFTDLQPKDYTHCWDDPIVPYELPPESLVMTREHGKKLWAFLLKKRDPWPEVFVFVSEGGKRAYSLALAFCDVKGIPRAQGLHRLSDPDNKHAGPAPLEHVFEMARATRHLVVG